MKFSIKKGFTLIELITVTGILMVITSTLAGILYYTLIGSNKTRITTEVSQQGNYALSIISDIIASSDKIVAINGITRQNKNCVNYVSEPLPSLIRSIQFRRLDRTYTTISISNTRVSTVGVASIITPTPSPLSSINLTDSSQVVIDSSGGSILYEFKCLQANEFDIPRIEVEFTLKQAQGSVLERQANATFKTSLSMKNYDPN